MNSFVYVNFGSGDARYEVPVDGTESLLMLASKRHDPRTWGMIQLILEYDNESQGEKENIERTLIEILRNEPISLPT